MEPRSLFLLVLFIKSLATPLRSLVLRGTAKEICGKGIFFFFRRRGTGEMNREVAAPNDQPQQARGSCYIWLAQPRSKLWDYRGCCLDQFSWPWGWQTTEPESQSLVQASRCIFLW